MTDQRRYREAGVDYHVLDGVKREALARARATAPLLAGAGAREVAGSRGASAYVLEVSGITLAFVVEGLGTKSLIAEEMLCRTGTSRYSDIATDAVATIVNDVISVGSVPLVVNAYFATGSAAWYDDDRRWRELLAGWQRACEQCGAAWGGGESPALPGMIAEGAIEMAGSGLGLVPPGRNPVLGTDVQPGDAIILLASSGLHANGATLARRVASELPDGLLTPLPSGGTLGDRLLDPTVQYAPFVRALLASSIRPTFLNAITGHGLLKIMRSPRRLRYVIETVPEVPEVLEFLVRQTGMAPAEAYSTLNMGAGYVVIAAPQDADAVVGIARSSGHAAFIAGEVVEGERSMTVIPLGIQYRGDDLRLH